MNTMEIKYCKCGCGNEVQNRFIVGHFWRGKKRIPHQAWNKGLTKETNAMVLRIAKLNTGQTRSTNTKRRMSEKKKGKKLSFQHCQSLRIALRGHAIKIETRNKIRKKL